MRWAWCFTRCSPANCPANASSRRRTKVQIDVRLDEVVLRALEKKPELRYQQASVLKTEVETIATTPEPGSSRREEAQTESEKPRADWKSASLSDIRAVREVGGFLRRIFLGVAFGLAALLLALIGYGLYAPMHHAQSNLVKSDYIGQASFPQGDSIEINSVERTPERMFVKGHYNLVSHDKAELALYITSTNENVPEGASQRVEISKGSGDFELIHSHLVPGWPHVSMYADGGSFAALYFGTRSEALEESKLPKGYSLATTDASQLTQQGWQLWQAQKLVEAAAKFQRAVELTPDNTNAWNGLGWALFNSGKAGEAEKAFQKAVSLDSNHPAALNGLGQICLSQRKYDQAETYLLKAAPKAPAAWYGLTRLYLLEGKFDQAEKWAQQLVDSGQADELAHQMLKAAQEKYLSEGLRFRIEPPAAAGGGSSTIPEQAALSAVYSWLSLMDGGDYARSWKAAADSFHKAVTQAEWMTKSKDVRQPLGEVLSRKVSTTEQTTNLARHAGRLLFCGHVQHRVCQIQPGNGNGHLFLGE